MVHDQSGVKRPKKRLIVCCDGTWMNSDYGFVKPGLFHLKGFLQVPSNVTRISRCFKRRCSDGTIQIINYESGVGTSDNFFDNVTGGAFGFGLAEVRFPLFLADRVSVFRWRMGSYPHLALPLPPPS